VPIVSLRVWAATVCYVLFPTADAFLMYTRNLLVQSAHGPEDTQVCDSPAVTRHSVYITVYIQLIHSVVNRQHESNAVQASAGPQRRSLCWVQHM
jgi:hypothetical protein